MPNRRTISIVLSLTVVLCSSTAFAAPTYISNVNLMPDWHQPVPAPNNIPGYPSWCSPTATANAFGWWEDTMGAVGLTDGMLAPGTTLAPAGIPPTGPGVWNERLWQDGTVELGWHMDTGGWQTNVPQPSIPSAAGTLLSNIGPGGVMYAQGAWVDGAMTKVAFPSASVTTLNVFNDAPLTASQIWNDYRNDIDAGLTVVVSWDRWVSPAGGGTLVWDDIIDEDDVYHYVWGQPESEGHTVTGVGYIDDTPQNMGDELIIVHDNWSTTVKRVAVPLFNSYTDDTNYTTNWWQNDHFFIPEPATLALLAVGGLFVLVGKRS